MTTKEIVAEIRNVLSSQSFYDWYEGEFKDWIEGVDEAPTTEEIDKEIEYMFRFTR
jgi:hypothetical protein